MYPIFPSLIQGIRIIWGMSIWNLQQMVLYGFTSEFHLRREARLPSND